MISSSDSPLAAESLSIFLKSSGLMAPCFPSQAALVVWSPSCKYTIAFDFFRDCHAWPGMPVQVLTESGYRLSFHLGVQIPFLHMSCTATILLHAARTYALHVKLQEP